MVLEIIAYIYHTYHCINMFHSRFLIFFDVYFSSKEMALEQIVKDLQTQNAQFQQMIMALAKGQEELKALIVKEKTKKPKKPAGVVNLGRRFRGSLRQVVELASSSKEETIKKEKKERKTPVQGNLIMRLTIMRSSILRPMKNTNSWRIV
ncbi:unnamed protein product [Vicia faba]|uniref:Uncharacterized protein n=1 Tax=Vicia faba TaxID=3906 RepID=A0AAV1AWW2_VICFA|nr:unnamed protein product [Vicia faba]